MLLESLWHTHLGRYLFPGSQHNALLLFLPAEFVTGVCALTIFPSPWALFLPAGRRGNSTTQADAHEQTFRLRN